MRRVQVAFVKRCNKRNGNSRAKISRHSNIQTYISLLSLSVCGEWIYSLHTPYCCSCSFAVSVFGFWSIFIYLQLLFLLLISLSNPPNLKLNLWCRKKKLLPKYVPHSIPSTFIIISSSTLVLIYCYSLFGLVTLINLRSIFSDHFLLISPSLSTFLRDFLRI